MATSRFEKVLPWSGVVAAACWVGQALTGRTTAQDSPGGGSVEVIQANIASNAVFMALTVVMGVALIFFGTAVRNHLRSGEAQEAAYSSVAFGGWMVVAATLAQMAVWDRAAMSAADDNNAAAVTTLGYGLYFGWLGMAVGLSAALIATGLGGRANAVLPTWFAVTSVILGALGLLGACGIPPGGLVNYLLLPVWLVAASLLIARRQKGAIAKAGRPDRVTDEL